MHVTVVIPTFMRPEYLKQCVAGVLRQIRLPDELIVVSREDDELTNAVITGFQEDEGVSVPIVNPRVTEPGFLPPIMAAQQVVSGDIVVFLDDDAEPYDDWLARLIRLYDDRGVGGVGGRYENYEDGVLVQMSKASTVGRVTWYGRHVGNMYRETTFDNVVEVQSMIGGNMSFRTELFRQVKLDPGMNANVAFYWELSVCLQVRDMGYQLLFDPRCVVKHYSAPRADAGLRTVNANASYWMNANYARLMRKHLTAFGLLAHVLYSFLVGSQRASGIVHYVYKAFRGTPPSWQEDIWPSIRGRVDGLTR